MSVTPSPAAGPRYDLAEQSAVYRVWAPIYDRIYHRLLAPAQKAAVAAASAHGTRLLEIGVGTGLALPYYRPDARVVGIDLSPDMLARAAAKARGEDGPALPHVRGLAAMDACRLGFPDASFDAASAQFVITLVPDPEAALTEMARVVRPGGRIVLASRFGAEEGVQARFEEAIAPLVKRVGWSSTFRVSRVRAWAEATGLARVTGVRKGLYFSVVTLERT